MYEVCNAPSTFDCWLGVKGHCSHRQPAAQQTPWCSNAPGASLTKLQNGEHLQCESCSLGTVGPLCRNNDDCQFFYGGTQQTQCTGAIEGIGGSDRLIELAWRITGGCWSTTPATGAIGIIIIIIAIIIFIVIIAIVIIVAIGIIIIANHHNWPPPPVTSAIAIRSLSDQTKMAKR